jgi:hypothetical protein
MRLWTKAVVRSAAEGFCRGEEHGRAGSAALKFPPHSKVVLRAEESVKKIPEIFLGKIV